MATSSTSSGTSLSSLDRLRLFLRPPGQGLLTVSTGGDWASRLATRLYGSDSPTVVASGWEDTLQKIRRVRNVGFGIPSDTGAGIVKGANLGPIGIREAYLATHPGLPKDFLDLGDVATVPHLLHDGMLSLEQKADVAGALYEGRGKGLPVSPLSIAEAVVDAIWELNPDAQIALMGGDHSVAWPLVHKYAKRFPEELGILHFDAHTDLMQSRFGVKYCFATWAYHAMTLLKPYRLVQVGIRVSGKDKAYWTGTYPVIQHWAKDVVGHETEIAESIAAHFEAQGVTKLYISNDIDGTDSRWAKATGTPEADGLQPEFVLKLIKGLSRHLRIVGGDVTELAPPLSGRREFSQDPTCLLAAEYWKALVDSMTSSGVA